MLSASCPNGTTSCQNCRMNPLCLPLALQDSDMNRLDQVIERGKPLQRKETVFFVGDDYRGVYAVRSGAIKAAITNRDGTEQITGFYLPGEIFGWDGLADGRHTNTATALETTAICSIPAERMDELSMTLPDLRRHFMQLMSREISVDQQMLALLSKSSADQRIAALLLSISNRLERQKLSATRFSLPMSRAEIGNYLGLTVETVSRVFSRFQTQALIAADRRDISLLQIDKLHALSDDHD